MKKTLHKEILEETYKDVQKLIFATAWDFWNIYGGSIDDLIGQANLIFIEALDDYDSSRGTKLTTWVAFRIKKGMLDYRRNQNRNKYKPTYFSIVERPLKIYPLSDKEFSVMELLDELGQDAHIVLQLFFDTPREIMVDIRNSHQRIDYVQAAVRNRLRNRLRQMGWTMKRIRKAFDEIKGVTSY